MQHNTLSVLQKATAQNVRTDPFPHIVLPNALPDALYDELAASFPSSEMLGIDSSENNVRWNYSAHQVHDNADLPAIWRDFIAWHSGQGFFDEIIALFGQHIQALYPDHFPDAQKLAGMRAGVRKRDKFVRCDIQMDAQISGNTPVTETSSVRSTHVDRGDKLFSGLFYMRPADYDAVGGDLTISRFKPAFAGRPERFDLFSDAYVDDSHVEHVATIPYDSNRLVLFINSLDSLHGVTVRQPSDKSRLFVNFIGEIQPRLYHLERKGQSARYLPYNAHDPKLLATKMVRLFNGMRRRLVG